MMYPNQGNMNNNKSYFRPNPITKSPPTDVQKQKEAERLPHIPRGCQNPVKHNPLHTFRYENYYIPPLWLRTLAIFHCEYRKAPYRQCSNVVG